MSKRVLHVGSCSYDNSTMQTFLVGRFDCVVFNACDAHAAVSELRTEPFDLVLINRKLDQDHSDGIDIIQEIKADSSLADTPVMLVTNFPEHQDAAEAAGALRGFGKLEFDAEETLERLQGVLG